jgi:excisionase family DNA binding protein
MATGTRRSSDGTERVDEAADESADEVMTAGPTAALLHISRWTLYAAAGRGEIPHRRLGRRLLFSRRALMAWLAGAGLRDTGEE